MEIYFDNILIDPNYYTQLEQSCLMFNEQDSFKLGATPCNSLVLGIDKRYITSIPKTILIKIGEVQYGNFKIDSYEENEYEYVFKITDGMVKFNFLYDASYLINLSTNMDNGKKYVTLLELLQDICDKASINLETLDFIGKDKHISWYDNTITAREYVGYIAELNGGYARINQNGNLEIKSFSNDVKDSISIDECDSLKIGEKHLITHVLYDNGIQKFEYGDSSNNTIQINSNNVFITSNEDIFNIYNVLNQLEFYSFSVENCPIGNAGIGDCIEFTDGINSYKTFAQFELNYFGNWLGGYKFKVNSSNVDSTTDIIGGDLDNKYKRIKTTVDRMNNELKITIEELGENTNEIATLKINVDSINQSVENFESQAETIAKIEMDLEKINSEIGSITDTTVSASGTGTLILDNVLTSELLYLQVYPTYTDLSYLYPADDLYPSDDLFLLSRDIVFTSEENEVTFTLPCDLLFIDSTIRDELIINYDTQEMYVIHRVGLDENGNKYALSEATTEYFDYIGIILPDGDYSVSMPSFEDAYIYVRSLAKNLYTAQYATKVELNSAITSTTTSINARVDEKITLVNGDIDELSGRLDIQADEIALKLDASKFTSASVIGLINNRDGTSTAQIKATNIDMSGTNFNLTTQNMTISSTNFSVDKNGNATMNNANVNGTIKSSNGTIGGWNINSSGLNNGNIFFNNNGYSNIYTYADMIILTNYLLGNIHLNDNQKPHYDLNGDGEINSGDLLLMQQKILGN